MPQSDGPLLSLLCLGVVRYQTDFLGVTVIAESDEHYVFIDLATYLRCYVLISVFAVTLLPIRDCRRHSKDLFFSLDK